MDDKSCSKWNTELDCLRRTTILDHSQSYCVWNINNNVEITNETNTNNGTCIFHNTNFNWQVR